VKKARYILLILLISCSLVTEAQVSQLDINRIEMMPNEPAPYNVRDWARVAMQYDSFVYDLLKTGEHLPLVSIQSSGVNYPQNPAFGLKTYVGHSSVGKEAINILPSLVGATLVGIDKSNQFDKNWVLMSQDFFNIDSDESIYLNNPGASSGNDWWYDMMPNIYFYQLNELYPDLGGDEANQFISIANRFVEAVRAMGGSDVPWNKAYMNYRAWDFSEMLPNAGGVKEPEAAGAFAWILYHAWKESGNQEYLKAAEWSIEFLNEWTSNPSYELQLPYGVYTAAKMNAELNTDYDIEQMVNWSFDRGPLRGWGAVVGHWGAFDVHGLIGEANDNGNDYAFQMNGAQQAAALVPMVRYDKRYARAIGKWVLNLANATRLFYPGYLPGFLQDASDWSNEYDPDRVVGYEALREQWDGNSPYSTGDAIGGGWAETNLALYGTSSIGYLGAIIEKTNDPKILKIDLLKTDFYNDGAYPTYLMFNPYNLSKTVTLDVGNEPVDIYEALSESFISQNVIGEVEITIPADEAVLVTYTPPGGSLTFEVNKMLVEGIVVDYMQTAESFFYTPRIQSLAAAKEEIQLGDSTMVYAKVFDQDSDNLTNSWSTIGGTFQNFTDSIKWFSPAATGAYEITFIVTDENNNADTATTIINVVPEINQAPQIIEIIKSANYVSPEGSIELQGITFDSNDDPVTYEWSASGGNISGNGNTVNWMAPAQEGDYEISLSVTDEGGLSASATTSIWVHTFGNSEGNIIAWYPFSLNGDDISGNELHGQVNDAVYGIDYFQTPESALLTDGINDNLSVEPNDVLNSQEAITVSCWFKASLLPNNEVFLLSHGSWQNRWKVSIITDEKIRWTVNTMNGIGDLDSGTKIQKDSFYHIAVTYDGEWMALYINGALNSYKTLEGNIRTTTLPLLVAQMLPDNTEYNYKGIIDEVKIFDYALIPSSVTTLFNESITTVRQPNIQNLAISLTPNPAFDNLSIRLSGNSSENGMLSVFDLNGRLITEQKMESTTVANLMINNWQPGVYIIFYRSGLDTKMARFVKI
jgi:hypothetical protein